MPRLDIALTPAERDAYLTEQRTLRLATVGPDGEPQVVPLWFVWVGGTVFMNTTEGNLTVRNAAAHPRVALTVDDGETYDDLRGVILRGRLEPADGDPRLEAAAAAFGDKYFGGNPAPFGRWRGRRWFRIEPDAEASWDFRKIPEARARARGG